MTNLTLSIEEYDELRSIVWDDDLRRMVGYVTHIVEDNCKDGRDCPYLEDLIATMTNAP